MTQNKTVITAILSVILMVLTPVLFMMKTTAPAQAQQPLVSCVYHEHPSHVVCKAGTLVVLDVPIPVPTITLPPIKIRVTGPTRFVTVRPPAIHVPGPTKTVTVNNPGKPGATTTVNVPSRTKTVSVPGPSGQTVTSRATVTPSPQTKVVTQPGETRTKTETIIRYAAASVVVSLVLAALGLLLLFLGYILGHKDAERHEKNFLRGLLHEIRRGKHS
jgi:hypothetical protein